MCDDLGAGELRGEGVEWFWRLVVDFFRRGVRVGVLSLGGVRGEVGTGGARGAFAGGSVKRGVGIARMNAPSVFVRAVF